MTKYAVLISSGVTINDDVIYHSEFWYDLFLMYKTLIENGFTHDNIYVLYGEGNDFNSAHIEYKTSVQFPGVPQITDYPNHEHDVQNIFSWLATGNPAEGIPALTDDDFLFVWWMGHGGQIGPCQMYLPISNTGESINDSVFASYVDVITHYLKRAFFFMTCHSGGMLDDLQGVKTVVETSSHCDSNSYSGTYDVVHAEFTYNATCALREETPMGVPVASDFDNNNLVSLGECFTYVSGQPMSSVPQISDMSNIAPCIFLKLPTAGKVIEIMSRDHINDDGTIPSSYQVWFEGPDLWVRNLQDGGTIHEDPEYGQTNYIYANVHNIGCGTATNLTVEFSWCEQTAWVNPALWNHIDTAMIQALGSLQSITVNVPWSNLPLPGKYCLHTRLNCPGDPENADNRAYMDNNKVQINVTVENNVWGMKRTFLFFVENAAEKRIPIDLEINATKILENTDLRVELPPDTRFEGVKNAEVTRDQSGRIILHIEPGLSVIEGLFLAPKSKERRMLSMTISTPIKAKIGQRSAVTVEEKVQGESKGGIQFIAKVSERDVVVKELIRRKANLFRGIAEELDLRVARDISDICNAQLQTEEWRNKKSFMNAVARTVELRARAFKSIKFQKIYRVSKDLGERYRTALGKLKNALEKEDETSTIEAEEETLLYMGALLKEFMKRRRPKFIKKSR